MVTVKREDIRQVVKSLMIGEDYREDFLAVLDTLYMEAYLDYFKKVVNKSSYQVQTGIEQFTNNEESDNISNKYRWYEELMLNEDLDKTDIALNAGINMKTINNMHNTTRKEVVKESAKKHFNELVEVMKQHEDDINQIDLKLNLSYDNTNVNFNTNEILIMINAMATIKSNIRGGIYSSLGQQIEKPLMLTLSKMLQVPEEYYTEPDEYEDKRQADFHYFKTIEDDEIEKINCEVKLMGKGNPESADAAMARYTHIFIANKISDTQKAELKENKILWIETQGNNKLLEDFSKILKELEIPNSPFNGKYTEHIDEYLDPILDELGF
ncbi:MAG: CfrBI family restriction endonuclease [Candidatus Odinarchaeota archaeon]